MKHDSRSCLYAEVDVTNARPHRGHSLGISFTNEIDIWSQIEFRNCHQIRHMRQHGTPKVFSLSLSPSSFVYSTQERLGD